MENQDGAELCFPQLLNASCWKPKTSRSQSVFLVYSLIFISVITVSLNLLVIISVSHFRQLHTPTNLLLLSLAVSDFLCGLVVTSGEVHRLTECWIFGDVMCSLNGFVNSFIISASVGNMVLISVDRYVAICDPLHYPTRVTVRRVQMCVCMCWTCSIVYNAFFWRYNLTQPGRYKSCYGICVFAVGYIDLQVDMVLSCFAPVTVIIILYMRVFVTAVSQARAMRSHVAAVRLRHSGTVTVKKSELKAARNLGVVVVVFIMCFCPYYCLEFFLFQNVSVNGFFIVLIICLYYVSPCLNPVIYALFYPWFRKAIRLIFSLQILQPGSRETNML